MPQIWLHGYKPIPIDEAVRIIEKSVYGEQNYLQCGSTKPSQAEKGPFDFTSTQSQAVLHTLRGSYYWNPIIDRYPGAFGELIRTSEESLAKTDFAQKLKVVYRLVERFNQIRANYPLQFYESSDFYWLMAKCQANQLSGDEVLFNLSDSNGTNVLLNVDEGQYRPDVAEWAKRSEAFLHLKREHESRNIFSQGSLEFILDIGIGYYIPVFGVNEISGRYGPSSDERVETLCEDGSIVEGKHRRDPSYLAKGFLNPMGMVWGLDAAIIEAALREILSTPPNNVIDFSGNGQFSWLSVPGMASLDQQGKR